MEYGEWRLNHRPRTKLSVETWLESEGRFGHLFEPGNKRVIEELKAEVDRRWERLLQLSGDQPNS
jgi:pyruvate ferredoxin oxidoreductase beta subunit